MKGGEFLTELGNYQLPNDRVPRNEINDVTNGQDAVSTQFALQCKLMPFS